MTKDYSKKIKEKYDENKFELFSSAVATLSIFALGVGLALVLPWGLGLIPCCAFFCRSDKTFNNYIDEGKPEPS